MDKNNHSIAVTIADTAWGIQQHFLAATFYKQKQLDSNENPRAPKPTASAVIFPLIFPL